MKVRMCMHEVCKSESLHDSQCRGDLQYAALVKDIQVKPNKDAEKGSGNEVDCADESDPERRPLQCCSSSAVLVS